MEEIMARSRARAPMVITATLMCLVVLPACTSQEGEKASERSAAATPTPVATTLVELEPETEVVVAGRRFNTQCAGSGPSVVLVAGYGDTMEQAWQPVHRQLGAFARACAYDRLGIGQSEPPPEVQTFADIADDLDGVITALKLPRPIVVVAHSLGGPIAMTWASKHPADAKAVVLLDASPPGFREEFDRLLPPPDAFDLEVDNLRRENARFDDPKTNRESLHPRSWQALNQLPRLDAPVLVLTSTAARPLPKVLDAAKVEAAWIAGQQRWVALSPMGRLERVERAGHYIQIDRPDVVIGAVRRALSS